MKFSTRTTYGLRAMIRLVKNKEAMSLPKIAKMEGISLGYLERLFSKLKKRGLIEASLGMKGGYILAKKAKDVSVFDIVDSLEEGISMFHCLNNAGKVVCPAKSKCGASIVLSKVQRSVYETLKNIKLSEIL